MTTTRHAQDEGSKISDTFTQKEIETFLDKQQVGADGNLIGILQETQTEFGYLPAEALKQIGGTRPGKHTPE